MQHLATVPSSSKAFYHGTPFASAGGCGGSIKDCEHLSGVASPVTLHESYITSYPADAPVQRPPGLQRPRWRSTETNLYRSPHLVEDSVLDCHPSNTMRRCRCGG